jgi:hypothetical protein
VVVAAMLASAPPVVGQVADLRLVSVCTPPDLLDAGVRTFRVDNSSSAALPVQLVNLNSGASVSGTAPPGSSFWDVDGVNGRANTTQLFTDSVFVEQKNSINRTCARLVGNASCDPPTGEITVTWTITNFNSLPVAISGTPVAFSPNPMPAGGLGGAQATASETVAGTAQPAARTLAVDLDLGAGRSFTTTAEVTLPPCEAPVPASMTFTFTKTANAEIAGVGDTLSYTYAGTNTSMIPLEVLQLVDDRIGVLLEEPQATIVQPGASLSATITYTVVPTDAGTTIENNAVVTVSDPATGRTAQGVADEHVDVALPPTVEEPPIPTTTSFTTGAPPSEPAPSTTATTGAGMAATTAASTPAALPATGPSERWAAPSFLVAGALLTIALGIPIRVANRRSQSRGRAGS